MRDTLETRFMWAVQALAQAAEVQLGLYPGFVVVADELALEHEEMQEQFLDSVDRESLSDAQQYAIEVLDRRLVAMSGPQNAEFWTEEALRAATEWVSVRALAQAVLDAMGWPSEAPPIDRGAIYVGPP